MVASDIQLLDCCLRGSEAHFSRLFKAAKRKIGCDDVKLPLFYDADHSLPIAIRGHKNYSFVNIQLRASNQTSSIKSHHSVSNPNFVSWQTYLGPDDVKLRFKRKTTKQGAVTISMERSLSKGFIQSFLTDQNRESLPEEITVQILQGYFLKDKKTGIAGDRFKATISDGERFYEPCLFATQTVQDIKSNDLSSGHPVISILIPPTIVPAPKKFERHCDHVIGNPLDYRTLVPFTQKHSADAPAAPVTNGTDNKRVNQAFSENRNGNSSSSASNRTMDSSKPAQSALPTSNKRQLPGSLTSNAGAGSRSHPISSLTPYQNKWSIRARVTNKTNNRSYSNSRGTGKVFSMDLADESGEIRATCFNDQADKFFDVMQINEVYYISRGQIKPANRQWSTVNNDYEIVFNNDTTVDICYENEPCAKIPRQHYNFTKLSEIANIPAGRMIDIIGVVESAGEMSSVTAKKDGAELRKRDLTIVDDSNTSIRITLWGEKAENFPTTANPILLVKAARISDFNGRSLSSSQGGIVQVNPDVEQAHRLRGWFDQGGKGMSVNSLSTFGSGGGGTGNDFTLFGYTKADQLGWGNDADFFTVKATVTYVKQDKTLYMACPTPNCNKKVLEIDDGTRYRCEKCCQEFDDFKWRLLLNIRVCDQTDSEYVLCFQDVAEKILGTTADELGRLSSQPESEDYVKALNQPLFKKLVFRLKVKSETYNDEHRLRVTAMKVDKVDRKAYNNWLIQQIEDYGNQ